MGQNFRECAEVTRMRLSRKIQRISFAVRPRHNIRFLHYKRNVILAHAKDVYKRQTVRLAPSIARLYPTVVIEDTGLYDMYRKGTYRPLGSEYAIRRTAAMYRIIDSAGINIIRVGLKSSDIINDKTISSGTFHPAFRQLVEGLIAREDLEAQLEEMPPASDVVCVSHPDSFNNMIGHKAANKSYFSSRFSSRCV